ncbi:AMP-binding protein [Aquamicrobium sp. LC103]|uniref:phenylacetate--CoA ligase family protein n=1 Tax=Aquamicrobium sp. LC103 TaxID=1120658 RepID=UPI001484EF0B|nr:AMP-binding protein [Aquamicrobium sp. LC103]
MNPFFETMPRDALDAFVERAVLGQLKAAARDVPFYKWYYARADFDPARLSTLAEFRAAVPSVTKRDFLAFQSEHPDAGFDPRARQVHLTSGTSGVGREVHTRTQHDLAAIGTGGGYEFIWAGMRPGDRVMLTMPYSQTMAGPYFQGSCEAAGVVPINAFAADTTERLEQLYRFRCAGLVATPSYVHRLTIAAREAGRTPAKDLPELRAIFVSGEAYGLEWAAETMAFWGAQIAEGWGATQTLGVAMASAGSGAVEIGPDGTPRRGRLYGIDHRCYIEVLEPGTDTPVSAGEYGEIVVTTLRTYGLPCIRFRMGDRVRLLEPSGAVQRPFSAYEAGSITRVDDMIKMRGMNIWPSAVDEIVIGGPVSDYSGRIYTDTGGREAIELRVELADSVERPDEFASGLSRKLKEKVGVKMDVVLIEKGSIGEVQFKAQRWRDERAVRR